ncbi:hypothetical protein ARALYDRAFT_481288 [Arabidopsis lyrata subsp. lyrata]|uniref:Uncharacterized protein n=1 Tax=Arabidopsis lyrata subsp. lyrata TaxID=81972 RepID=D7LHJ3_ARALL|nr:hypothetical protein ARALYDRAFT_481288 [Arabidopsis lyrata subsp. lyrata]
MAENVGSDSSEIESITSSQKSFLKNCPFAGHEPLPTKSTDSDNTEVLGNKISPAIVKTPVLSFSSPTSLDSISDEVFRTPPENASLSSATESEPRVRVSEIKLRGGTSPSSEAKTMPVSSSSSLPEANVRVSKSNLKSPSSTAKTPPVSTSPLVNVRVSESNLNSPSSTAKTTPSNLKSPSSTAKTMPVSASPSVNVRVSETNLKSLSSTAETTPVSASPSEKVRVFETKCPSDSVPLSSPPSVAADDVRVPAKHLDSDSSPPTAIGRTMGLVKQLVSASVSFDSASSSASEGIKTSEAESSGGDLPFKEIIEALLRNSGENLKERDDKVSYVEILKQCGLKFPK